MGMNTNKAWTEGKDGNIYFNGRKDTLKRETSYANGWEKPIVSTIVLFICGLADFTMFKSLFGSFLVDSVVLQYICIACMLVGFDVAPIYIGIYKKKVSQGYKRSDELAKIGVIAFGLAFVANLFLRIMCRDILLPSDTAVIDLFGSTQTTDVAPESNPLAMTWAIFGAIMPLITSLCSYLVSYFAFNPLKMEHVKYAKALLKLDDSIEQVEAAIAEDDADPDFLRRIKEDDELKYNTATRTVDRMVLTYSDYVRERIKEHLGDPVSTSQLSIPRSDENR